MNSFLNRWAKRIKRAARGEARVELHGRAGGTFTYNGRTIRLYTEYLAGRSEISFDLSCLSTWSDGTWIENDEKQLLAKLIIDELKESGLRVKVIGNYPDKDELH